MSEYTAGPWEAAPDGVISPPAPASPIALAWEIDNEGNSLPAFANARLIAAAPEMVEVLKAISERYNTDDRMGGLGDWVNQVLAKALGQGVLS